MHVIALLSNKGGVGKTTLAINIASALSAHGSCILIDADPQGSSQHWADLADEQIEVGVTPAEDDIKQQVNGLEGYDYCVIDCPPSADSTQTQTALRTAQNVIIPVLPSPLDLWASVELDEQIQAAKADNPAMSANLVINQMEPRTRLSRQVADAMAELNLPALQTPIHRRVIYRNAILAGRSVHHMGKKAEAAANEINDMLTELGIQRG